MENVNEQRRRVRESLRSDIGRLKKKLDDIGNKRDKCEEVYKTAELAYRSEVSLIRPNDRDAHDRLHAILTAAYESYAYTVSRLTNQERVVRSELEDIERDIAPIRLLSTQSNQKHLVVNKHNSLLGWVPSEDQYVLIQNSKPPSPDEILRKVSHEPETELTNLPLSIYNLIQSHFERSCEVRNGKMN